MIVQFEYLLFVHRLLRLLRLCCVCRVNRRVIVTRLPTADKAHSCTEYAVAVERSSYIYISVSWGTHLTGRQFRLCRKIYYTAPSTDKYMQVRESRRRSTIHNWNQENRTLKEVITFKSEGMFGGDINVAVTILCINKHKWLHMSSLGIAWHQRFIILICLRCMYPTVTHTYNPQAPHNRTEYHLDRPQESA